MKQMDKQINKQINKHTCIYIFFLLHVHFSYNISYKIQWNFIFRAPIARMKMILRPVESPCNFLSSDSVKPSK